MRKTYITKDLKFKLQWERLRHTIIGLWLTKTQAHAQALKYKSSKSQMGQTQLDLRD